MIGKTIGDYRILEKRGEGGMGMFFKAQDIRLDRLVGLKTIRAELLHDLDILGKLEEEAKSLARLDHPNIARLLHYMVVDEQHYIVMEYVDGLDLAEILHREGPLSLDLLASIVPQICAAIGYAHRRNVIHRDIKPSNILLTQDGTIKVTDFGIAKILGVSTKTKTGVAIGSLPYMAPEQIRGAAVDARTDIYQLGVLLFELLTGRRPFLAETEYDMMSHHLSTPPPKASAVNEHVPVALDSVILRALAKAPTERFGEVSELADTFRRTLSASGDSQTVYGPSHAPPPPISKNRQRIRLWGGIAIGVLAVLAFVKVFMPDTFWKTVVENWLGRSYIEVHASLRLDYAVEEPLSEAEVVVWRYGKRGLEEFSERFESRDGRVDHRIDSSGVGVVRIGVCWYDAKGRLVESTLGILPKLPLELLRKEPWQQATYDLDLGEFVSESPASFFVPTLLSAETPEQFPAWQIRTSVLHDTVYARDRHSSNRVVLRSSPRAGVIRDSVIEVWSGNADSVVFLVQCFDSAGTLLLEGRSVTPAIGRSLRANIALSRVPAGSVPASGVNNQSMGAVASRAVELSHKSEEAGDIGSTLTLDVQPLAERDRVETVWLDGKKQSGQFPLALNASPGLRTIRWQVGNDYWTDTVTVREEPVEKHLMFDLSRGRINITVTFSDGPAYAEVLLDGQQTGQGTPGELRNVASGPHEVTLKRDGYRMQDGPVIVRVRANDRVRVNIPMEPR